jgi:hypothetical protein
MVLCKTLIESKVAVAIPPEYSMQSLPAKQFTLPTSISKDECLDRLSGCNELLATKTANGFKVISNQTQSILLGPVAHGYFEQGELRIQLVPPVWTWAVCLLTATYLLLNVFEAESARVLIQMLAGSFICWLTMMCGFWLDRNRTERVLRSLFDEV